MMVQPMLSLCLIGLIMVVKGFPAPFNRLLEPHDLGSDVFILQNLLRNNPLSSNLNATSSYDAATISAVKQFQQIANLTSDGIAGIDTQTALLQLQSDDDYVNDNTPASQLGYSYKIVIPVHQNRSVETIGHLESGNGTIVFQFQVRSHGYNDCQCNDAWPNFNSSNIGLNMFSSDGNTPTGLMEADLNSPEDEPKFYGPYPVNRAVKGLKGNAQWLVPGVRDGVLLHTGLWPGWRAPEPMPNSEGCMHAWPDSIDRIQQLLVEQGIKVRPNPGGKLPYPYRPQGLLSVYRVNEMNN
eukprot:TRINITY_DN7699_c0_g1_i2.p1 TRINITY_DN7699_c0_g1~~TRINITY_DN7699_c0_g1_i2.p1  ORF type:complete len:297 (+),score=21.92 TRINITY_DN7699_c0_g1_i2:420-1310(+)